MVGKTSITIRYIQGEFVPIDKSNRTINASCFEKRIQLKNKVFNLSVWDTAGEEKYHAMTPIFYRGAHGAIIIFDVTNRETFKRASKWFHELTQFAEGSTKIILVGNKIDLPNREISRDEAMKLAKEYNCEFFEVSALEGINVDQIFESLTMTIYNYRKKNKIEKRMELMDIKANNNTNNNNSNKKTKLNIINDIENMGVTENRKGSCC